MHANADVELQLNPRRALLTLAGVNTLLVGLSLGALVGFKVLGHRAWLVSVYKAFNVDTEGNVPAIYSSLQLLLAAGLIGLVAVAQKGVGGGAPRRFAMLAGLFVFLAGDEAYAFHEWIGHRISGGLQMTGMLRGCWSWILMGTPVALAAGAFFLPLVWKLHRPTRLLIIAAATLFVGGALGLEGVGGVVNYLQGKNGLYFLVSSAEEWCEMTGISVLVFALLRELSLSPAIRLAVAAPTPRDATIDAGAAV